MIPGVQYRKVDDAGLHITVDGKDSVLPVDNVILCAGQDPQRALQAELEAAGCTVHLIGGADKAVELDAKRAIKQGTELALRLDPSAKKEDAPQTRVLRRCCSPASPRAWRNGTRWCPGNQAELASILHPKAVFRSPMAHTPYPVPRRCSSSRARWQRCSKTLPTTAKW